MHYSHNWVFNPSVTEFSSLEEAKQHIKNFKTLSRGHKSDTYEIVQVLEKGKIKEQPTLNGVMYEF